jgi:excisionase family DNA binding protein
MSEVSGDHKFYTAEEAAAYLRVSLYTVWRWCKQGRLPAFQIGRSWRIRKDKLDALIKELEAGSHSAEEPATAISPSNPE